MTTLQQTAEQVDEEIEIGCSECGIGGGHALYCVRCAEKFVEAKQQIAAEQVQYTGNGTAGRRDMTAPTGFWIKHNDKERRTHD